ncbi:MAG: tetratricopeptide repeat protein [Pseudomonadota bacterium]
MTQTRARPTLLSILLCLSLAAHADGYATARAKLVEAYQAGDFAAMQEAARASLTARPDYPGALFNLALAQTLADDPDAALQTLARLTDLDVDLGVDINAAFEPLHELDGWARLVERIAALRQPVGNAVIAWQGVDGGFVPEGIAVDGNAVYLGSIRRGSIDRIDDDGVHTILAPGHRDVGSIYGMRLVRAGRFDPELRYENVADRLLYATAATEQLVHEPDFSGSRLCEIELARPEPRCIALPARGNARQTLGDFIEINGLFYTADQTDGPLYVYDPDSERWGTVVEKGQLVSPQGLVDAPSSEHLYVADYRGGVYRVRLDGYAALERVKSEASLYGIDGLYRYGDWLIAVQNGITPHRVSAHRLADDGLTVIESRILLMNHPDFDEPNLGEVVGDDLFLVANSHWNRFKPDNTLPEGLSGPVVLKLSLTSLR